jgi:hypothetical protein
MFRAHVREAQLLVQMSGPTTRLNLHEAGHTALSCKGKLNDRKGLKKLNMFQFWIEFRRLRLQGWTAAIDLPIRHEQFRQEHPKARSA